MTTPPKMPHGEAHCHAKLNPAKVREIRARYAADDLIKAIAIDHGVTDSCIIAVVKGRTWKHVAP